MSATLPKGEIAALTGLRGLAAWFVVLYHVRLGLMGQVPDPVLRVLSHGYLAVDLFFMLSGFVLWLTYADKLRSEGLYAYPRFIVRRLARIWPLHLFVLGLAVLYAAVLAMTGRHLPLHYPWSDLPAHIFMVQAWGFTPPLRWNDPAWSISGEFAAYLLFPLLALAVDWRRLPVWMLLLAIAGLAALLHLVMAAGGATVMDHNLQALALPRALIQFAIGTILCALWLHWRGGQRAAFLLAIPMLAALALVAWSGAPQTALAPSSSALLLFAVAITAERAGNPLAARPVHYLGQISYSTYLIHFLLFIWFKHLFVDDASAIPMPLIGLFLLLTFGASVALFHSVERPAQRLFNTAYDNRTRKSAALAV